MPNHNRGRGDDFSDHEDEQREDTSNHSDEGKRGTVCAKGDDRGDDYVDPQKDNGIQQSRNHGIGENGSGDQLETGEDVSGDLQDKMTHESGDQDASCNGSSAEEGEILTESENGDENLRDREKGPSVVTVPIKDNTKGRFRGIRGD